MTAELVKVRVLAGNLKYSCGYSILKAILCRIQELLVNEVSQPYGRLELKSV